MSDEQEWCWIKLWEGADWMPALRLDDTHFRDPLDGGWSEPFEVGPTIAPPAEN